MNNVWVGSGNTVLAHSLNKLNDELNARWPNRPKQSDGSIGDNDHQARASDHNPHVRLYDPSYGRERWFVTALDTTDWPRGPFDIDQFLEMLRIRRDYRVKYAICDGRFYSSYSTGGRRAWTWAPYSGPNGHFQHGHLSVLPNTRAVMSTESWFSIPPTPPEFKPRKDEEDMRVFTLKGKSSACYGPVNGRMIRINDQESLNNLAGSLNENGKPADIEKSEWDAMLKQAPITG